MCLFLCVAEIMSIGDEINQTANAIFRAHDQLLVAAGTDLCATCTEPAECGHEGTYEYDMAGNIISCSVRVQIDEDAGPTGDGACEECGNIREEYITTEAWGHIQTDLLGHSCTEDLSPPESGHYCESRC